jgi:hypothetical protein
MLLASVSAAALALVLAALPAQAATDSRQSNADTPSYQVERSPGFDPSSSFAEDDDDDDDDDDEGEDDVTMLVE